jgi:hypothetical protein
MAETGTGRIVFASSAHVYGWGDAAKAEHDAITPASADGIYKVRVEEMLAASDVQWVAIRSALIVGRSVDNWVRRLLALPAFPDIDGSANRHVQVVHIDDALRLLARAVLDTGIDSGPVNLGAPGVPTFRQIAAALGRPIVPLVGRLALGRRGVARWPSCNGWKCATDGYHWPLGGGDSAGLNADESVDDVTGGAGPGRGGKRVVSLPVAAGQHRRPARRRRTGRRRGKAQIGWPRGTTANSTDRPAIPDLPGHKFVRGPARAVLAVIGVGDRARPARRGGLHRRAAPARRDNPA